MIGTAVPSGAFTRAVADYEARVAALVAEDDELASYVSRLESMMGDDDDDDDDDDDITEEASRPDDIDVHVDSEQFLAEVERFLRDAGPGSGDATPPDPGR
jgi:outer membrane protein TolC